MKLVPLADKVVLKVVEKEETTKSGIVIATASKEKSPLAEVIAVGPGGMVDGYEVEMQVKVGQKVVYPKFAGQVIELDKEEYLIMKQSEILAIVE
ncbi:MAG: co-chaperone GroES [Dorea sp.]|nr:co-chaperone GroES [Dorea sp.]